MGIRKERKMKKNTRKLAGVIIFAVLLIFTMVGCGTEKLDNTVKVQGESDDWMNDVNSSDSARRHYKIRRKPCILSSILNGREIST